MPWHSDCCSFRFSWSVSFFSVSVSLYYRINKVETFRAARNVYNLHVDKMSSDLLPINYPLYFVWQQSRLSQGITMEISTGGSNRRHILSHCLLIGQCSDMVQISDIPLFIFHNNKHQHVALFNLGYFKETPTVKLCLPIKANESHLFFLLNSEIRLQVFCSPLFVESCGYWQYSV